MRLALFIALVLLTAGCTSPPQRELEKAQRDYAAGDFDQAARKARQALSRARNPVHKQAAQELLAQSSLKQQDYPGALRNYEELLRQEPQNRRYQSGVQHVREILRQAAVHSADEKLARAQSGFHHGDVGGATRLAQEALVLYQGNAAPPSKVASSQALIGQCYVQQQRFAEAEQQLQGAVQQEPQNLAYQTALQNAKQARPRVLHLELEGQRYDIPVLRLQFSRRSVELVANPNGEKVPYLSLRGPLPVSPPRGDGRGGSPEGLRDLRDLKDRRLALRDSRVSFGGGGKKLVPAPLEGSLTLRQIAPASPAGSWDVRGDVDLKWSDGKSVRRARGTLVGVAQTDAGP